MIFTCDCHADTDRVDCNMDIGFAGNFGQSAAIGQILPPKPQMVVKQDWRYVSGGGQVVYAAHTRDCEITSLAISADDTTLLSRSTDETLKVRLHSSMLQNSADPAGLDTIRRPIHSLYWT
jgi:hypothetical protein